VLFYIKTRLLIARILCIDVFASKSKKFTILCSDQRSYFVVSESITPFWTEDVSAERQLQRGKVQNLRIAIRSVETVHRITLLVSGNVLGYLYGGAGIRNVSRITMKLSYSFHRWWVMLIVKCVIRFCS
jgi:hypothetical protein